MLEHINWWRVFHECLWEDNAWREVLEMRFAVSDTHSAYSEFLGRKWPPGAVSPSSCLEKSMAFSVFSSDAMVTARFWTSLLCLGYSLRSFKMLPKNICMRALLVCLNWMHNASSSGTHTLASLDRDSTGATEWLEDTSPTTLSGCGAQGATRLYRSDIGKF